MLLQVMLPFGVHREVDTHLRAHLSHKTTNLGDSLGRSSDAGNIPANEGIYEQPEPTTYNSVVKEKILRRRSLQLHHQQEDWQVYCLSQSEL